MSQLYNKLCRSYESYKRARISSMIKMCKSTFIQQLLSNIGFHWLTGKPPTNQKYMLLSYSVGYCVSFISIDAAQSMLSDIDMIHNGHKLAYILSMLLVLTIIVMQNCL